MISEFVRNSFCPTDSHKVISCQTNHCRVPNSDFSEPKELRNQGSVKLSFWIVITLIMIHLIVAHCIIVLPKPT